MLRNTMIAMLCSLMVFTMTGCDTLLQVVGPTNPNEPSTLEIVSGLKEALQKGAKYSVGALSKEGGYFKDPLVKIPFPQEAKFAADKLNQIGMGGLVTEFERLLNKGAEEGAKQALPIFASAIKSMTIQDAKNILFGGENAATNYFKQKTKTQLYGAYSPHVRKALGKVKADQAWSKITTTYNAIPLTGKKVETDLVKYATDKALDGLFLKVAEEEKKIRKDPLQRTTEILKKVFGFAANRGN